MIKMVELIPEIKQELINLGEKKNLDFSELNEKFLKIYNDPFIKEGDFSSELERQSYVFEVLKVRILSQPPAKLYTAIPFGYSGKRVSKTANVLQSKIYVLVVKENKTVEKKVIFLKRHFTDLINDIKFFHAYKTYFTGGGNVLLPTEKTSFVNGKRLNLDPIKFVLTHLDAKLTTIAETPYKLSRKDEKGKYTDEFDLRLLKGIVLRYNFGEREDGTKYAVYTIGDGTVDEETVTDDGIIIPSQFTVWVPFEFLKYDEDSELYFLGTIALNKDKIPFMNAINVFPVHAKPLEVVESE